MKNRTKLFFILIATSLLFAGCRKSELPGIENTAEGLIVLGQKLENPYTVGNMRQAYTNLKSSGVEVPDLKFFYHFQMIIFGLQPMFVNVPNCIDEMMGMFVQTSIG